MENIEMVGEQVLHSNGPFMHVRRWIKDKHPNLGKIHYGLTGWETQIEKDVIKPNYVFVVEALNEHTNASPTS